VLDPPYDRPVSEVLAEAGLPALLAPGALLVVEHARRQASPERAGGFTRTRLLTSGDSALSFYARA
jgi:16S rRNA G966 N2-methylase RsmD